MYVCIMRATCVNERSREKERISLTCVREKARGGRERKKLWRGEAPMEACVKNARARREMCLQEGQGGVRWEGGIYEATLLGNISVPRNF